MKRRQPRIKVSRRRGLTSPDDLARQMTDYLLKKTTEPPTLKINSRRMA